MYSALYFATLTLFSFTSRLLDTRSLTSRYALSDFSTRTPFLLYKIYHSYTHTHIHANASILLVLDVRPEGLAINSLKAQAWLSSLFMLYDSGHLQSSTRESLGPFPRTAYPTYIYIYTGCFVTCGTHFRSW